MQLELTKEYIDALAIAIASNDTIFIKDSMEDVHAADISSVLDELDTPQSKYVIDLLPKEVSAEILSNLDAETRKRFLKAFEIADLASFIPFMDSDDAADMLNEQPVKLREEVITLIEDKETRGHIRELLRYDDDCAGGLMAKELIKANLNWTVVQTVEEIRRQAEMVEKLFSVYVVDDEDVLQGRVSVKRILLAKAGTKIIDIYEDEIVSVPTYAEVSEVADIMQRYDLESLPVVNEERELVGRITIDDIVDVITEKAETEQQLMAGITSDTEVDDSVFSNVKARLPWLLIGLFGGILGANFINLFKTDISALPIIATFIPLITATGGNVGIQSSTVIIQLLGTKTILGNNYVALLLKVLIIALVNGLIISLFAFGIVLVGQEANLQLAAEVSFALLSVVILASMMGTVTPIVLDKFGVNPAVASGPFITTANDLLGLAVYFGVIHLLHS